MPIRHAYSQDLSFSSSNLIISKYFESQLYDKLKKIKSVAYSSQGSHTSQLDFCNWLAGGSMAG